MASGGGLDRRILRAFYTQYVAVLLMILVFWIGTVYAASPKNAQEERIAETRPAYGSLDYSQFFTAPESAEINNLGGIEAVSEVLKNHDLRGVFAISVALSGDAETAALLVRSRARAIKMRAIQVGVPAKAIKIIVTTSAKPSAAVQVSFESSEVTDVQS